MAQNSKWPGTDHLGSGKRRRDVLDRDLLGCSVEGGTAALSEKRETEQRVEGDAGMQVEQAYFILLSRVRGPGSATAAASKVF